MVRTRQHEPAGDRLAFRYSLRTIGPHAVLATAGMGLSAALLASFEDSREIALVLLALVAVATLTTGATLALLARKPRLAVGREGLECGPDGLVVPWDEVVSLALAPMPGPSLRIEVRDWRALLARQPPEVSIAPRRERQLAELGAVVSPVAGFDSSPHEVFDAAAERFREHSRGELETIDSGPLGREVRRAGSGKPPVARREARPLGGSRWSRHLGIGRIPTHEDELRLARRRRIATVDEGVTSLLVLALLVASRL